MPVRASGQWVTGLLIGCSLVITAGCNRSQETGGKIGPFDAFDDAQVPFAEGPPGPEQAAAAIELNREHGFAPLSETLGILVEEATFELARPAEEILVRTDVFHKAAHVNGSTRVSGLTVEEPATSGRIAIHLIDADYLPVGDAAENTYQIRLTHSFDDLRVASIYEIPKSAFDASRLRSTRDFKPSVSGSRVVPLFAIVGNSDSIRPGKTPEELIRANPSADVLVVSVNVLRWADDEPGGTAAGEEANPPLSEE